MTAVKRLDKVRSNVTLHQIPEMSSSYTEYKIDNNVFLVTCYETRGLRMPVLLGYTSQVMAQQDVVALD